MTESGAGGCVDVRFEGQFAIITMRRGQNRMNLTFFEQMHEALDKVERLVSMIDFLHYTNKSIVVY